MSAVRRWTWPIRSCGSIGSSAACCGSTGPCGPLMMWWFGSSAEYAERAEGRQERVVEAVEDGQQLAVDGCRGRLGAVDLGDVDELGGDLEALHDPERLHPQQRGAERRGLRRLGIADLHPEHVAEQLPPPLAAREAARGPHLAYLDAGRAHRVEHERELQA